MEKLELITLIGIAVLVIGIILFYYFRKKKDSKHIPIPLPTKEWDPILNDLKTAMAGITTRKDYDQLLSEFEPRVKPYMIYPEFRMAYNDIIDSIVFVFTD